MKVSFAEKLKKLFGSKKTESEEFFEDLTDALIEGDIGAKNAVQIVDELENMSDSCYATLMLINRSIEKKMKFPQEDMERLLPYLELVRQFLQFIRRNINNQITPEKLELARELENGIDAFRKDLKKVARKRLEGGADVKAELLYIDVIRRIENIGDNCFNISESLLNW